MNTFFIGSESDLRLAVFVGLFVLLALLETRFPRRQRVYPRSSRWPTNLGLSVLNTIVARILIPLAGVGAATYATSNGFGMLPRLPLPGWLETVLFLLLFDLTIYLQHRLFHRVPWLWRLHRVHHTDPDYDVTTGNRFHPLSILLSGLIKTALILLTGPQAVAVVSAEILLNATSMFNHSNIRVPLWLDRRLRVCIVTPDMHRVHHSVEESEHNHNFGFNFSWWDRIFSTYLDQPRVGHQAMDIGIKGFQTADSIRLGRLLIQPLKR